MLSTLGYDIITIVMNDCCGEEFNWVKLKPGDKYGEDMPKYCPLCGVKIREGGMTVR